MSAESKIVTTDSIVRSRLARKASRSDFYFRPDPWVEEMVVKVESVLNSVLHSGYDLMDEIGRHMLFAHAKRLRPIFMILSQHIFHPDETLPVTLDCAAAAELIHCASLFHDDVIDDADYRKGVPAANTIWGSKSAVIMGDQFFVYAYRLLAKQRDFRIIEFFIEMCSSLAHGILREIDSIGKIDISEGAHFEMISQKTAVFFRTCAIVGGYIAGASDEEQGNLGGFGLNFGLAFQLSDDLLDLFSDPEVTGKPRGSDLKSGIFTAPIIHAMSESPDFTERFRQILSSGRITESEINDIALMLKANGTLEYCVSQVKHHADIAVEYLDKLPTGRASSSLKDLLDKVVERKF